MDTSAFYAIVSGINFTLLGLWWVAVKDRPEIAGRSPTGRRMAYLVSLQFAIPGTIALLGQVAPDEPVLWRVSFTVAALAGAVGVLLLGGSLRPVRRHAAVVLVLWWVVIPIYILIAIVAAFEGIPDALNLRLSSVEIEGLLLTLFVFIGVQLAWVVSMAPRENDQP
jgi:hypothetical protein